MGEFIADMRRILKKHPRGGVFKGLVALANNPLAIEETRVDALNILAGTRVEAHEDRSVLIIETMLLELSPSLKTSAVAAAGLLSKARRLELRYPVQAAYAGDNPPDGRYVEAFLRESEDKQPGA